MDQADLSLICDLVLRRSGIVLDASKEYLVEARLSMLAKKLAVDSIKMLVAQVRTRGNEIAERAIVAAMTTNETSFFRDLHPFETFKTKVMPAIIARRAKERKLAIWCAASSTGQEPYSLAILLKEHFPQLEAWDVTFVASDLSREVLQKARTGHYTQLEMNRGLPAALMVKYFKKMGLEWEVIPEVRKMIDFREINLLGAFPALPPLDVVFIRNVLIYFNQETKKEILGRIRRMIHPEGFLFLGAAETTLNLDENFQRLQADNSGCYRIGQSGATLAA
jgi:chemotaxis protein methyltransferase CheR